MELSRTRLNMASPGRPALLTATISTLHANAADFGASDHSLLTAPHICNTSNIQHVLTWLKVASLTCLCLLLTGLLGVIPCMAALEASSGRFRCHRDSIRHPSTNGQSSMMSSHRLTLSCSTPVQQRISIQTGMLSRPQTSSMDSHCSTKPERHVYMGTDIERGRPSSALLPSCDSRSTITTGSMRGYALWEAFARHCRREPL